VKRVQTLALVSAMTAVALVGGCKESASDKVFGERVRTYLLAHPEVLQEVSTALDKKQVEQARLDQDNAVAKIKAAIPSHRAALERDPMDYVANPNGKVTVTQFFDFRCGHCKNIAPDVIKLIAANPDVRFVFKDYPIFGGESDQSAALALAAKSENKYLSLYQGFIQAQDLGAEDMQRIIAAEGIDYAALVKKASDPAINKHLLATHKLAKDLGIEGTPHFRS
jgi:protein-disulfide isomerase